MNEIIEMPRRESAGIVSAEVHQFSAIEIRQRVNLVQEVMRSIMKSETHYGVIPGTKKPSLYKPGAEVLCVTFRIADKYEIEDLTVDGMARYRVRCIGIHQVTGVVLGEGMGECSSHEEKYKWRASICAEEFEVTPENLRRLKFSKWNNKVDKKQQIRTESADQANTILKMACKRAKIAMTLNVTGASDIFTQDIEDLPEELREHDESESGATQQRNRQQPERRPPPEDLLKFARGEAAKGVNAYQKFWGETTKENRQLLASEHDALKAIAAAVDAQRSAQSEQPREPGADDELEADFQKQLAREQGEQQ